MNRISRVRDCKAPYDATWRNRAGLRPILWLRLRSIGIARGAIPIALIGLLTLTQSACLLPAPLAIFPQIKPGSGATVEICDQSGKPVHTEGLLIINRDYRIDKIPGAPSNAIAPIRDGKATIPMELAISSTWGAVGVMPSVLGLVPFAWPITDHYAGTPTVIILVPGSNAVVRYWLETEERNPMRIRLVTNPATQADSWREILASLRGRYDKPSPGKQLDLRFDHYHYWKARNFIEAELARLGADPGVAESASAKTEPSSAPARNSTRP